jgi:hypothetical protein
MKRLAMVVLWPSFLVAIIAEGFFFSAFDPQDLAWIFSRFELSAEITYTFGFFCFWLFAAMSSLLTSYLIQSPNEKSS